MFSGHGGQRANGAHAVHSNCRSNVCWARTAAAHIAGWPLRALARSAVWSLVAVGVWATLVAATLGWLGRFSATPGTASAPPTLAAAGVPLLTDGTKHLLVMAIHPRCPCSKASIGELTRLLTWHRDRLSCAMLVFQPPEATPDWRETSLVASAQRLPGAAVIADVDGRYAEQLGMSTSGAVVLYSPNGTVEFHGGITLSRGHWGDNLGADAVGSILAGVEPRTRAAPVFGCPIR